VSSTATAGRNPAFFSFDDDFPMFPWPDFGEFFSVRLDYQSSIPLHVFGVGWFEDSRQMPPTLVTFSDPRQTQPGRPSWNNSYDGMVFSAKHLSEKVCYRINMGFSDIFKT
jgi:hypothetical protein